MPGMQGELRKLGEDVSEMLEYVPASFVVIRQVRTKLSCTKCDCIVQAEAPSRPIARGIAGPGLLAHVLVVSTAIIFRCIGNRRSMRARMWSWSARPWPIGSAAVRTFLQPLVEALRRYVMAASKLHADDTPVPVLAPGQGKTKTGRVWTYVRDDRPAGDTASPAVWFAYSPDRKGEHPAAASGEVSWHAAGRCLRGIQSALRKRRASSKPRVGRTCGASFTIWNKRIVPRWRGSAGADRGTVWHRRTDSRPARRTSAARSARTQAQPLLDSLRQWFEATLSKLSRKSETTAAIRYALSRWDALARYIEDGHIEIGRVENRRSGFSLPVAS